MRTVIIDPIQEVRNGRREWQIDPLLTMVVKFIGIGFIRVEYHWPGTVETDLLTYDQFISIIHG